jgi:iron complex transport system substrate-binding protein
MKLLLLLFLSFSLSFSLHAAERIITLSPAVNEIVYALGSGDDVVGNTLFCLYPKASQSVTKVGGYSAPSLESIVALRPTLVILQKHNYKLAKQLKKLHITTHIIKIDSLQSVTKAITNIGRILNHHDKAQNIIQEINNELLTLKNIVANKKILIVIGHNTSLKKRIFVTGKNLYFEDIIKASGNSNAYQSTRTSQPILNQENIIASNPDIVILLAHSKTEYGLSDNDLINPWLQLPINAAKTKNIFIVEKEYAGIPSDRLIYFIEDFKGILNDAKTQ